MRCPICRSKVFVVRKDTQKGTKTITCVRCKREVKISIRKKRKPLKKPTRE